MHRLGTGTTGGVRMDFFRKVRRTAARWDGREGPGLPRTTPASNRDNTFVQAGGDGGDIIMFARDTTAGSPYHRFPGAIRADEYRLSLGGSGRIIATPGQTGLKVTNWDYVREHPYPDGDFLVGTTVANSPANGAAYIMFRDANYQHHSLIPVTGNRDPQRRFGDLWNGIIRLASVGRSVELIGTNTSPAGRFYGVGGIATGNDAPNRFSSLDVLTNTLTETTIPNTEHDEDGRADILPLHDNAVMTLTLTKGGRVEGAVIDLANKVVVQNKIVVSGPLNDYVDVAAETSYDKFGNSQFYLLLCASQSRGALLVWANPR